MKHVVKIELTLTGEAARLYEITADSVDSVDPADLSKAVVETGLVHHALMLSALQVFDEDQRAESDELVATIGERTIMKDLFDKARTYWDGQTNMGTFNPDDLA